MSIIGILLLTGVIVTSCSSSPKSDAKKAIKILDKMYELVVQSQSDDNADQEAFKEKGGELRKELENFANEMKEKYSDNEEEFDEFIKAVKQGSKELRKEYQKKYPDLNIPRL